MDETSDNQLLRDLQEEMGELPKGFFYEVRDTDGLGKVLDVYYNGPGFRSLAQYGTGKVPGPEEKSVRIWIVSLQNYRLDRNCRLNPVREAWSVILAIRKMVEGADTAR